MSARSALKAVDERKRPRQSNFGSLSAGLIERGRVPAEVLYGADADKLDRAVAPVTNSPVVAKAERAPIEPFEDRIIRPPVLDDAAEAERLAAAERTRPLETSFGSLTEGMLERGKFPRQFLTKEQVELLLGPQKVAPEVLLQAGEAADTPDDDDLMPAPSPPVDHDEAEPIVIEPSVEADAVVDMAEDVSAAEPALEPTPEEPEARADDPTPADADAERVSQAVTVPPADPAQSAPREPDDPTLPILHHTAAAPEVVAPVASAKRKPGTFTRPVLWAASLFVAAFTGWSLVRAPETPVATVTEPAPAAVAQVVESVAPAPAEAVPAADPTPQVASTPAAEAPAVEEAAADALPVPSRQRPGAVPYEPPPFVALAPPVEVPSAPAPAEIPSTIEPPKPAVVQDEPAPAVAEAAPPVAPPAPANAESESTADLLRHGDDNLMRGDIATARLFYERAAEAGSAQAMLALAQTYDPALLRKLGARGIRPEPELAQRWYGRAAEAQAKSGR